MTLKSRPVARCTRSGGIYTRVKAINERCSIGRGALLIFRDPHAEHLLTWGTGVSAGNGTAAGLTSRLVAVPDRRKAVAALHIHVGTQIDVSAATRVTLTDLEIAGVSPGKILAL
jgi:hypothetical protein